jgi:Tol biopolymer transport system component
VALLAVPAKAAPVQITFAPSGGAMNASISADGQRVAFYSSGNITGANADQNFEIFLYDRTTNSTTQVSNSGPGMFHGSQVPQISADGNRIVYQQFAPTGTGSATFQTLLYDHATGLTRSFAAPAVFGETNTISGDGRTVLLATGNVGRQIFNADTGTASPLIAGNSFNDALSFDGRILATEGFGRLDVLDRSTGVWRNIAPSGSGFNMRPDLSDDGRFLAFTSTYNPLGLNADRSAEVFVFDLFDNTVRQVTSSGGGDAYASDQVTLSGDGTRLAFVSTANLLGTNADGNQEVFFYDLVDNVLTQVTQTDGFRNYNLNPSLDRDGSTLAWVSAANLTGTNASGQPQLFMLDLDPRTGSVPVPGTLPLLGLAGLALVAVRRR